MKEKLDEQALLYAGNAAFVEGLYEDFLVDPGSVPAPWADYFSRVKDETRHRGGDIAHSVVRSHFVGLPSQVGSEQHRTVMAPTHISAYKQAGVNDLINAYRLYGHLMCELDPLHLRSKKKARALQLSEYRLGEEDMDTVFMTPALHGVEQAKLRDIIQMLQETYTGHLGIEYKHIRDYEERQWIEKRLESTRCRIQLEPEARLNILRRLTAASALERFLHTRYAGQKRFSLEGSDVLIPALDELIHRAGSQHVKEIAVGMAHRGRLNVLINIMGKLPSELFLKFEDKQEKRTGTGDVKYHEGYSSNVRTPGGPVHLALAFNPSHLEIIDPVVIGSVRARQDRRSDSARDEVLGVLIHGDAAIAGQGVVYETFNLSQTRGFTTGGTIHFVVNNQIGFTLSNPMDTRSTLYCTDIGKVVNAPILHVNGDDPEAVLYAVQFAIDYRMTFHNDVLIDIVCYRRHGHNEADEPSATQPMMYKKIAEHKPITELYAEQLIAEGVCTAEQAAQMVSDYREALQEGRNVALDYDPDFRYPFVANWAPFLTGRWGDEIATRISVQEVRRIGQVLTTTPNAFQLHPRVAKVVEDRGKMAAGALPIDWGCAEMLAYGSLLDEGFGVRLTGQDSGRGTFFHRHAVLHNQRDGSAYIPLQHVSQEQALFTIVDSILSEEAVMAYEFGYSATEPRTLVIWEAQFGDFANGAQVVIDQFITSSEQKWRRLCSLVLMLPHGLEGQGPEHSSARLERFLQLCAQDNIQVCYPSTPSQMFHLLRRQMVRPYRRPLVIMSPKSMLRRKSTFSTLEDITERDYLMVIGETVPDIDASRVERVVLCTGKVYWDLLEARQEEGNDRVALLRIEQLSPFPRVELKQELENYPHVTDICWAQEEPRNQGAWHTVQHDIRTCMRPGQTLSYAGRYAMAAPAGGGSPRKHLENKQRLIQEALTPRGPREEAIDSPPPHEEAHTFLAK